MLDVKSLIARGYFARELPPPFTTERFAQLVGSNPGALPTAFNLNANPSFITQTAIHNLARPGGCLRRRLGIPNPINYYQLVALVANNWQTIEAHCRQSPFSLTTPKIDASGKRAVDGKSSLDERPIYRARVRATSRVILRTDLSQFYPSLYTHSVPWALHGKAVAKAQGNVPTLLGNLLDRCMRNAQDQQTTGIPIGPDASLIIAEIVLTAADLRFAQEMQKPTNGFRYIDDYELGFPNSAEAERALSVLQGVLTDFELQLNPGKTQIIDLPSPVDNPWTSELRVFSFRRGTRSQRYDLIRYFDRSFELAAENPADPVLRYAVGRMSSARVALQDWSLYQHLLLQAVCSEPGVLRFVLDQLKSYLDASYDLDATAISATLHSIVIDHAPRGQGSEVAWALWGFLLFGLPIDDQALEATAGLDDPVVALLALDAVQKGLASRGVALPAWQTAMTQDELVGRLWLLSYEANVRGWLPSVSAGDHVSANRAFRFLKDNGIYFYDDQASLTYIPPRSLLKSVEGEPATVAPPEQIYY